MKVVRMRHRFGERVAGVDLATNIEPDGDRYFELTVDRTTVLRLHPVDAHRLHSALGEVLKFYHIAAAA